MSGLLTQNEMGVIQRALQLADEGHLKSVSAIQIALMKEEFQMVPQHLSEQSIRRQLKATIKKSARPK